jgi:glycosyltransferase involved in cell wall biosynthesis
MKFLIIIPAHNEEENIFPCLESLKNQTFQDFKCVIVNDGSTDKTQEIAEMYKVQSTKYKVLNLEKSEHQPGAKVVRTFNKGLETENLENFDVVCKFDADIVFPSNYLEKVNEVYEKNPNAGMVSGLVYIRSSVIPRNEESHSDFLNKNNEWTFENFLLKITFVDQ